MSYISILIGAVIDLIDRTTSVGREMNTLNHNYY